MLVRIFLPFFAWILVLLLLTIRAYETPHWQLGGFNSYSIIQCLLFIGLSHISIGVLKKQLKFELLKDNAVPIVIIFGILFAIGLETLRLATGLTTYFHYWNLFFDILGVLFGIGCFRLVYRTC